MDHYEELGLDRRASPEEIRQAYKRLARLLHPDHCGDEPVRQLADLQMKRLNAVLAVLTNPAERADYDRALASQPGRWRLAGVNVLSRAVLRGEWWWKAAGAVALLSLVPWLLRPGIRPPPARQLEPAPPQTGIPENKPVRRPVARRFRSRTPMVPGRSAEADSGSESPAEVPGARGPLPEIEAPWTGALPGLADEMALPAFQPAPAASGPARPTLSGEWLYAPPAHSKNAGLYPPEYIELRVTEEGGILRGRYRARYHIPDQAISPTVWFQFAGAAEGDQASFPWIGTGGAKGEVSLRLVDHGAMEVTWVATQMGEELGLISGTATLVRRLD